MKLDLCYPCSITLQEVYSLKKILEVVDGKITCAECKRRRYGATYEATRKTGK